VLVRPHVAFPDQFPPGFKQVANYTDQVKIPLDQENWIIITDALANVVSPIGTAGSAHLPGIDFAGKTGSAQTISNQLKAKMGSSEKSKFKDNGWFVGVTPRRNPEIVVACLFEGGEHGALAARVAAKVIKAYVEKQRTRQTLVAKASGTAAGSQQAEVAAVWHEGDAKTPDKMQAGHFTVPTDGKTKPVTSAPGVGEADKPIPRADLETTESHVEMAHPETEPPAENQPTAPATTPEQQAPPAPPPTTKKPAVEPTVSPAAAVVPRRQP
jgi:penicillin-binding protein 2